MNNEYPYCYCWEDDNFTIKMLIGSELILFSFLDWFCKNQSSELKLRAAYKYNKKTGESSETKPFTKDDFVDLYFSNEKNIAIKQAGVTRSYPTIPIRISYEEIISYLRDKKLTYLGI